MLSTFSGIEMGKRALNAFRLGMQTVGHNISNMDTEGYSRQRVNYSTVQPMDLPGVGQVGQGVKADEIVRIRDEFLDFQYRSNAATLGYWDKINSLYDSIQNYISEPDGEGVRAAMDTFFNAMQSVQQMPEDAASRRALVEAANSLGGMLSMVSSNLDIYAKSMNQEVLSSVEDANRMLHEIAALNKQIYHAEALDQNANDLRDKRDLLLDKLSQMMDITYQEPKEVGNTTGEFFLTLNGRTLIQGDHVRELRAHAFQWDGQKPLYYDVQVAENEFDIVENCYVADILAAGPEGVHQLVVDRIANGETWTIGGGDAHCLETDSVTTVEFKDGILLDDSSKKDITRVISFRTLDDNKNPVSFTVKIEWKSAENKWEMSAETSGGTSPSAYSGDDKLTVKDLADFLQGVVNTDPQLLASDMKVTTVSSLDIEGATNVSFTNNITGDPSSLKGEEGVILNSAVDTDDRTLTFSTPKGAVEVKITWNGSAWDMSAIDVTGSVTGGAAGDPIGSTVSSSGSTLTVEELADFLKDEVFTPLSSDPDLAGLKAVSLDALLIEAGDNRPIDIIDYSGMLGALSVTQHELTAVNMRSRPMSVDEALGITGSFRIQVGSQGTRVTSDLFRASAATGLADGEIMGPGSAGDKHTLRIGVADHQVDITASWNNSTKKWELTSDLFANGINAPAAYPATSTGANGALTVADLTGFLQQTLNATGDAGLTVYGGTNDKGIQTQFYIESTSNHLISISDVEGNLAQILGGSFVNENPAVVINVEETDSLAIIRNKINEKYQAEYGLTEPEQWVHASLQQDSDQSWYLTIAANVPGEAQRITLLGGDGADDTSMQVLRRLGMTSNVMIGSGVYREVSAIVTEAVDASFTFNTVRYLSSDNMFNEARRIPASGSSDYSATKLTEVEEGMWFNLKHAGMTAITVRHHVKNGSIKALEEARDSIIPNLKATLDEIAYELVQNVNAYQYSGYGIGNDIDMTGVAFFDPVWSKAGAAKKLSVNDEIVRDNALIGAAMGRKDGNGKAMYGVSAGSGDGSNAGRMSLLSTAMIVNGGTMTLGGDYDAMLAQIGAEAGHAKLMFTAQSTVMDQIDQQRKAVSGVNLDEELMDIIVLNRAFGAMSRYINTIDEMLDRIINGMGLVGR